MPNSQIEPDGHDPRLSELISMAEAARLSGHTSTHLRLLARKGELWAHRIDHFWVTTEAAIREYMARETKPGPKNA